MTIPLRVMPGAMYQLVAAIGTSTRPGPDRAIGQCADLDPALDELLFGSAQQGIPDTLRGPAPLTSAQPSTFRPAEPRRIGSKGTWGAGP